MLKKAGLFLLAVFITVNLYAVTFSVNDQIRKSESAAELNSIIYPIAIGSRIVNGISFDELFPPVYEAWGLSIESESSAVKLSDSELGNNLSRIYLIKTNDSWSVIYKNRVFPSVTEINIDCEPLENDPIEIWVNWEGIDLLRSEISRYAERNNIEIKVTEVPKPDSKLISVTQANGDVPDIIMVQSSHIERLARSGSIQNLDYMYPETLAEQGRSAFSFNDRIWGIPFYYDAQMVFFNPEIISAPDFDWDLADFERYCRQAVLKGKIPAAWNSYSASFLIPFQIAFGKSNLLEPDGSIIMDDEPTLKALNYVLDLQEKGLMQPMERDAMTSLFVSGDAAMIISASYAIPHFKELGIPFNAVPLPVNSETNIRLSPLLDFKAFAIAKRSRNTIGARRLIEYLCGAGVQYRFTQATAKLPALKIAWETAGTGNPYFETLSISSEAGTVIPTEKAYSIYKNTMWKMLRFAISGRLPADQVLEKTQELVDKNME